MDERMHNLSLEDRRRLVVTSCDEIISFNENEINLSTQNARLVIKGVSLKVEEVSKQNSEAVITGESIDSIVYSKHKKGRNESLLRRIVQ